MTPKALEPVERVALNIEAAHKWLSDGQAPHRTEVERCLCINKALAHLEIARAALEAAQPLPDIEKVERLERVDRQLATGNGSYETPNGKLMYRVEADDLAAIVKLALAKLQEEGK